MRENKYRGRRSYDNKWIYGSLLIDRDGDFHIIELNVVEKDGHHILIDSDYPMFFDNETVGQYTEMKDANEVEIYEGDIVTTVALYNDINQQGATNKFIVKYFCGNPCFCETGYKTGTPIFPFIVGHKITVIGNIHEVK